MSGDDGEGGPDCCGGGGGGAGATGGQGGTTADGTPGGAGGPAPGANGSDGTTDNDGSGSGGGGGGHGFVGSVLPTSAVKGGDGGNGGLANAGPSWVRPTAGGGGAGGYGAVVVGSGSYLTDTLSVGVTGGNGGAGGDGYFGAPLSGGSGGSGGIGVFFANSADRPQFMIDGAVTGGNGGAGGAFAGNGGNGGVGLYFSNTSYFPAQLMISGTVLGGNGGAAGSNGGVAGLGGAGLEGASMDVTMLAGGGIAGGMNGDSTTRANAINFTAGRNALRFTGPMSQLSGNINVGSGADLWLYGAPGLSGGTDIRNVITGSGTISKYGADAIIFTAANTYSGGTVMYDGTLKLSGAGTLGDATSTTTVFGGTLDLGTTTQTQSSVNLYGGTIQNGGLNASIFANGGTIKDLGGTASLTTMDGTTTLLGTNSYSGDTIVYGGTLDVRGTITGTSSVGVYDGATLTGTGIIDPPFVTIYSGGTFKPGDGTAGSFTTIEGSLAFQSGAIYSVMIDPSTASFAKVIAGHTSPGIVTIDSGATVNAVFANGSYINKRYTILTTTDGRSGTFDPTVIATNLPANFHTTLSYDANNVYLGLALNFVPPPGSGLNRNQQAVGNALVNSFNTNGGIPMAFGGMTAAALTLASGEVATGAQQGGVQLMNLYLSVLTDPTAGSRGGVDGGNGGVMGYAPERSVATANLPPSIASAYAMTSKAPSQQANATSRWNVWGAAFGGSNKTSGDAVTVGSHDVRSNAGGVAAGADYRLSSDTRLGFSLAGGATAWSLAGGLGNGRSDVFLAGLYGTHNFGAAYVSGAASYGNYWTSASRTVTVAGTDTLQADFNAQNFGGRVEGGYRIAIPVAVNVTPYAAVQVQGFRTPSYGETAIAGSAQFALNYEARTATAVRTELGGRIDKTWLAAGGSVFSVFGKAAWAHDEVSDPRLNVSFISLPMASFAVNGATPARDLALTTAGVEWRFGNGISVMAKFEGEFAERSQTYAGTARLRYAW
ncbi:autotransporter outer membrane beta-barrel domain-containing protein [Tardiphaga sp.]|uniref:autotransporter family protein n=1 Tax=Tardiphaga sp. TaxID=1926292 RepID=UPI002616CBB5|nr:autotransporter outer membrane beta-barrel domain-containing protein [Tardiphaga sp.]